MPIQPLRPAIALVSAILAVSFVAGGCGTLAQSAPVPTRAGFQGIAGDIVQRGIRIEHLVSGEAGCNDANLSKTAIAFDAVGLDQPTAVRLYLYIFRNRDVYQRLRSTVDICARSWVSDPATFETVETSPYVVAGQGPWGASFKANLRAAIEEAAGSGD